MNEPIFIALSTYAMATRFELVLHGEDQCHLRAAGEEALEEITGLDDQLSLYRPESELSWVNARAAREPVKVEPRLFRLLQTATRLHAGTDGAFDVTIGPLMRAWGFAGGGGKAPEPEELEAARNVVGMEYVRLNEGDFTVRFERQGVTLDLGAIGKGYAIECAVESLRENQVSSALLHGGTSTACAIGTPPGEAAWRVAIRNPAEQGRKMRTVDLCDSSLSVSAVHGKSFVKDGHKYGHVMDPRAGKPVGSAPLAAVTGGSSTECDALSTALLVLGESWLPTLAERFPGYRGFVMER